jgi:hypothetical protein
VLKRLPTSDASTKDNHYSDILKEIEQEVANSMTDGND